MERIVPVSASVFFKKFIHAISITNQELPKNQTHGACMYITGALLKRLFTP